MAGFAKNLRAGDRLSYVVYNSTTGTIAHIVHVEAMPGAEIPSDEEIKYQVRLSAARTSGIAEDSLSVLSLDQGQMKPNLIYEVDLQSCSLIEVKVIRGPDASGS